MYSLIIEMTIYFKCISNMANFLVSLHILLTILFLAASLFSFFILCLLTVKAIFIESVWLIPSRRVILSSLEISRNWFINT